MKSAFIFQTTSDIYIYIILNVLDQNDLESWNIYIYHNPACHIIFQISLNFHKSNWIKINLRTFQHPFVYVYVCMFVDTHTHIHTWGSFNE